MFRVLMTLMLSTGLLASHTMANEVNVSGSTSVSRIMDVLAEDYNQTHPESYIAVQGIGSTAGLTLVQKGVIDVAMTSRYLTEREQSENYTVAQLAFDGLTVVVNPANPVDDLTREQLYKIYKGQITNWKELGGQDQTIAVVTREASSGTRYSFESLIGLTKVINDRSVSDINPNNLVVNSNSMVKTLVNHNKQAIGFISTGSVDRSVKAVTFEGVVGDNDTIAKGQYALSRPFLLVYNPEKLTNDAKAFLKFLTSNQAQVLIEEYGYTPLPSEK
ncbi:phosphate ABC transporter substrate-binding protein PstS family protein [Vibrio astriarenae]|uniref:Phosphate-binding protein n=1 Tax=Vibrio astriarenae TaxID=1481923 RepID=A0A7Z2T834_9VIBR|nr:phosphate ABC transporter substrate-binding protein [Vibrio astriarenae]QIA66000.1 phosphate ABC transporter substrate-binding protein PstS family protein [Vibrio astriarenae]